MIYAKRANSDQTARMRSLIRVISVRTCNKVLFTGFTSFRYEYSSTAFLLVLFHDFLDHLDGIVAKVQKTIYGQVDDPILGGFMDAFCDKVDLFYTLSFIFIMVGIGLFVINVQ